MSQALATLHQDLQDLIGHKIAERYRIDDLLGVGGMGAVFRAHHLGLKRDVAIKVLHPDLTRHPEISARFDREAHSASRLEHPNCLQVTDYGSTENGMKFMVMQLLQGKELSSILGRRLEPARALVLALQILKGLEHAHRHGVVHRDIKPENVFITVDHDGNEILKLVDFGIAKIVGANEGGEKHRTQVGLVFGTPAYMSPEQAAGMEADERADLYSVGIILYEMLAGRPPFDHEDPVALVRMQVGADPPPLPTEVPPVLAAAVEKLLAKDRAQRYQSASEAIEILEGIRPLIDPDYVSQISEITAQISAKIPLNVPRPPTLMPIAPANPTSRLRDRRVIAGAAGLLVLLGVWVVWPSSEDAPANGSAAVSVGDAGVAAVGAASDGETPTAGIDHGKLAELDRLLLANKLDEADSLLGLLRDEYPRDPELLWRKGRLLAKRKGKEAQALAAYGSALDADPGLLEDKDFYAELYELLRNRKLRDEALELALHKMGPYGHKFLLEEVNNEKRPLGYTDRRRALEELKKDANNIALINTKLNMALDLLQAPQSLTPCKAYADALGAITVQPDYYFYPRVEHAEVPVASGKNAEDDARCEGLAERRQHVLEMLAPLNPDGVVIEADGTPTAEDPNASAASGGSGSRGSKTKKKRSTTKKSTTNDDCKRVGGIFKKKCWK